MKACIAQFRSIWEDSRENLRRARAQVEEAASRGADLICFPEQFLTGWSPGAPRHAEGPGGPLVQEMQEMAAASGIHLLGAVAERWSPKPRNTCLAIGPQGQVLATYAKTHLFTPGGEHLHFSPGDQIATFSVGTCRCGIAICYDLRFAPLFRVYALAGVHCMLVPAAWPCRRMPAWEALVAARAVEIQGYVLGINTTGKTPVEEYCGGSLAADPNGRIIARAGTGDELLEVEVDPAVADAVRHRIPVQKDFRPDLYHRLMQEGDHYP
ncbi:MAG: carbon-nitrogen hydrolase family protein [Methanomicrobiales archaeon]|nr:carbon-nitrogen hydrolase family protein [Methanomicrobiales archaeon]